MKVPLKRCTILGYLLLVYLFLLCPFPSFFHFVFYPYFEYSFKKLLPENTDNHVRNEVLRNSMKIDSLSQELQKKQEYIDVIRDIVAGNINIDSSYSADIVVAKKSKRNLLKNPKQKRSFLR